MEDFKIEVDFKEMSVTETRDGVETIRELTFVEEIEVRKVDEPITIIVNKNHVKVEKRELNGSEIKEAAILQKVAIQQDFNLFIAEGEKPYNQVGDMETITVYNGEKFRATAPDDNS